MNTLLSNNLTACLAMRCERVDMIMPFLSYDAIFPGKDSDEV